MGPRYFPSPRMAVRSRSKIWMSKPFFSKATATIKPPMPAPAIRTLGPFLDCLSVIGNSFCSCEFSHRRWKRWIARRRWTPTEAELQYPFAKILRHSTDVELTGGALVEAAAHESCLCSIIPFEQISCSLRKRPRFLLPAFCGLKGACTSCTARCGPRQGREVSPVLLALSIFKYYLYRSNRDKQRLCQVTSV